MSWLYRAIGLMSRVFAMVWKTEVQSQVDSYQRLKKRLALNIIRIKGKAEQPWEWSSAQSYTWCSSYWKGSLRVILN